MPTAQSNVDSSSVETFLSNDSGLSSYCQAELKLTSTTPYGIGPCNTIEIQGTLEVPAEVRGKEILFFFSLPNWKIFK